VELLGPTPMRRPEVLNLIESGEVGHRPDALKADTWELGDELCDFETLVHLRYQRPATEGYWSQLAEEVQCNVLETVRLLQAATMARIEQVCFASSINVYTPPARGVSEWGPVGGEATPYVVAKLLQEAGVRQWARLNQRPATVLRLATVFGPGETVGRAVPNFIRSLLAGQAPRVDGRGCNAFDLVYVDDVAVAFERALECGADGVFNIGTGIGRTPRQVATILIRLLSASCGVEENHNARDRGGPVCSVSLAEEVLGFRAATSLEEGLRAEIEWFRDLALTRTA
jgi:nucleoside-diphosphate-sugar epimerase